MVWRDASRNGVSYAVHYPYPAAFESVIGMTDRNDTIRKEKAMNSFLKWLAQRFQENRSNREQFRGGFVGFHASTG